MSVKLKNPDEATSSAQPARRLHGDAARLAVRLHSILAKAPVVVLVGGVGNGHGADEIATRLSLSLVTLHGDRRILLLDANLKAPTVARYFDIQPIKGIGYAATAEADRLAAVDTQSVPRLAVLPALDSDVKQTRDILSAIGNPLLSMLREQYDIIVISGPEDATSFEFALWAAHADHVVLAANEGVAKSQVVEARKAIEDVGSNCAGVVVTEHE